VAFIQSIYCGIHRSYLALAVAAFFVLSAATQAAATSYLPLFDTTDLIGVDTVVVGGGSSSGHALFPPRKPSAIVGHDAITLAVKDVFSKQPWISVKGFQEVDVTELSKPNVIFFDFDISAQQDSADGRAVAVGSLGLQLWKYHPHGMRSAIAIQPATFPFLMSASAEELDKKLDTGARFLTSYFPYVLGCLKTGGGLNCSIVEDPWGQRPKSERINGKLYPSNGEKP